MNDTQEQSSLNLEILAERLENIESLLFALHSNAAYLENEPFEVVETEEVVLQSLTSQLENYIDGLGLQYFKGRELTFTSRQRIFYENNHQSVEFIYARPNGFKAGKHEIELYAEGYLIGLGTFEVR